MHQLHIAVTIVLALDIVAVWINLMQTDTSVHVLDPLNDVGNVIPFVTDALAAVSGSHILFHTADQHCKWRHYC